MDLINADNESQEKNWIQLIESTIFEVFNYTSWIVQDEETTTTKKFGHLIILLTDFNYFWPTATPKFDDNYNDELVSMLFWILKKNWSFIIFLNIWC